MLPFILFCSYMSQLSTYRDQQVIVIQHKELTIIHPSCSYKMYVRHSNYKNRLVIAIHSTSKSVNLALETVNKMVAH